MPGLVRLLSAAAVCLRSGSKFDDQKPLDLGYAAISLAGAVEAAMAAIYELQSDISNNTVTRSTSIVNGLRGSRSSLHNEFEVYIALLEDSQRYVKEGT